VKNAWNIALAACFGAIVGFSVGQHMSSKGTATPSKNAQALVQQPPALAVAPPGSDLVYKVALGDAPRKGDPEAKVTIVEWSDFQCPFCGRVVPTLQQIEKTYGADVRFVFKNNPLPMHPDAPYAARAAIAAHRQGKFWQMHDKLFSNQSNLERADLEKYAQEIGLDMNKFKAALDTGKFKSRIQEDAQYASKVGARGTPSFFINGKPFSGAQPFENFKQVIDQELARAEAALKGGTPKDKLYEKLAGKS
jgi:protein-disulfide isomerase